MKHKLLISSSLTCTFLGTALLADIITSPPLWEKEKIEKKTSIDELIQRGKKYEEKPATKRKVLLDKNLNPSGDPAIATEIKKYSIIDSSSGIPEEK